MRSMLEDYHLFASPFDDICRKAGEQNVKKISFISEKQFTTQQLLLADIDGYRQYTSCLFHRGQVCLRHQ